MGRFLSLGTSPAPSHHGCKTNVQAARGAKTIDRQGVFIHAMARLTSVTHEDTAPHLYLGIDKAWGVRRCCADGLLPVAGSYWPFAFGFRPPLPPPPRPLPLLFLPAFAAGRGAGVIPGGTGAGELGGFRGAGSPALVVTLDGDGAVARPRG